MPIPCSKIHCRLVVTGVLTAAASVALAQNPMLFKAPHAHPSARAGVEHAASPEEHAFLLQNDVAMAKMMADMEIKPTGDIDRDFVAMMLPHHQGAIDMAIVVLRYGRNEQIRRLAQEIIVTQRQEMTAMRLAIGEPIPPSTAFRISPEMSERANATPYRTPPYCAMPLQ